jgi:hypothetical protein
MSGEAEANRECEAPVPCAGDEPPPWDDPADEPDAADRVFADAVDGWVRQRLAALRREAQTLQIRLETELRTAARGRALYDRGQLGVRVREQPSPPATPGAFTVEWCTYSFGARAGTPAGTRACYTSYIPKGNGDRYPMSAFRGKLRNWQRPIVDAAEARFATIRRTARHVAQVRTQMRLAVRAERAMREALRAGAETEAH